MSANDSRKSLKNSFRFDEKNIKHAMNCESGTQDVEGKRRNGQECGNRK